MSKKDVKQEEEKVVVKAEGTTEGSTEETVDALAGVEPCDSEIQEVEMVEEQPLTLEEVMAAKDAEIRSITDRLQRQMAEFDNFRKRTIKEKSQMYESGAKEVLEKLLPVVDNFERAFMVATDNHKEDPFVKGIDLIYKQLITMLDDLDVEEIEALNEPFDPNLHHAVQHETSEEHDDNLVVDVYQKGYMYKDAVLRYSMVKVVN